MLRGVHIDEGGGKGVRHRCFAEQRVALYEIPRFFQRAKLIFLLGEWMRNWLREKMVSGGLGLLSKNYAFPFLSRLTVNIGGSRSNRSGHVQMGQKAIKWVGSLRIVNHTLHWRKTTLNEATERWPFSLVGRMSATLSSAGCRPLGFSTQHAHALERNDDRISSQFSARCRQFDRAQCGTQTLRRNCNRQCDV